MKKEIKFRGRTAEGEWIYGFYLQEYQDNRQIKHYILRSWFDGTRVFKHKDMVIPETVGQYTGLNDKNGKKIFEGDKVKFTDRTFGYSYIGDVCFDKGSFCILYEFYGQKELHRIGQTDKWQDMGAGGTITYYYEVIGNIFDKESDNGD